jgi:hypothetical protein
MFEDYDYTNKLTTEIIETSNSIYQKTEAITVDAYAKYWDYYRTGRSFLSEDLLFQNLYINHGIISFFRLQPIPFKDPQTKSRLQILPKNVFDLVLKHDDNIKKRQWLPDLSKLFENKASNIQEEIIKIISYIIQETNIIQETKPIERSRQVNMGKNGNYNERIEGDYQEINFYNNCTFIRKDTN